MLLWSFVPKLLRRFRSAPLRRLVAAVIGSTGLRKEKAAFWATENKNLYMEEGVEREELIYYYYSIYQKYITLISFLF